jgi:hypothetical protein
MLASLVIDLLIASLLFLLFGWIGDVLQASTSDGRICLDFDGPTTWNRINRPRRPLPYDDPGATGRPRPVRRHQLPGRLP